MNGKSDVIGFPHPLQGVMYPEGAQMYLPMDPMQLFLRDLQQNPQAFWENIKRFYRPQGVPQNLMPQMPTTLPPGPDMVVGQPPMTPAPPVNINPFLNRARQINEAVGE